MHIYGAFHVFHEYTFPLHQHSRWSNILNRWLVIIVIFMNFLIDVIQLSLHLIIESGLKNDLCLKLTKKKISPFTQSDRTQHGFHSWKHFPLSGRITGMLKILSSIKRKDIQKMHTQERNHIYIRNENVGTIAIGSHLVYMTWQLANVHTPLRLEHLWIWTIDHDHHRASSNFFSMGA